MAKNVLPDFNPFLESLIPASLQNDPERYQRCRFIIGLSGLGLGVTFAYAMFFLTVYHYWGAFVMGWTGAAMALIPLILRWTKRDVLCSHLHITVMTVALTIMAGIEGGLHGHALGWIAAAPLCALLILNFREAIIWCVLCGCIILVFGFLEVLGVKIPLRYPPSQVGAVTTVGFFGLGVCLFFLGWIFENNRRRAQEQMLAALAELSHVNAHLLRLNQEKTDYLGVIAHDLRNPLTAIYGSAEILQLFPDMEMTKRIECVHRIQHQAARMRDFLTDLLDVKQLEEGHRHFDPQACNLAILVAECMENYREIAQKKNIRLNPPSLSSSVLALADPKATLQILDNLLSNAIKYSPHDRAIHFHLELNPVHAICVVADEGPGISETDLEKLFQKFSRTANKPTGGESSNGLGLFISRQVARSMKGDLDCQSKTGEGSRFILRLPCWVD
jgi:signal transduction histidine kinase